MACYYRLLWLIYGLLYGIVASWKASGLQLQAALAHLWSTLWNSGLVFRLLGVPGSY